MIRQASRRLAGILLVVSPTVESGGYFLLTQLIMPGFGLHGKSYSPESFRAGHGKAVRDVDEANLSAGGKGRGGEWILALGVRLPGKTAL